MTDTIRRTAVEVAMKTQLVPHHFDQPVDELEFALNGMMQLHEEQLLILRQRIEELEFQIATCQCRKDSIQSVANDKAGTSERDSVIPQALPNCSPPIGALDSEEMSVISDSSNSYNKEFDDVSLFLNLWIIDIVERVS